MTSPQSPYPTHLFFPSLPPSLPSRCPPARQKPKSESQYLYRESPDRSVWLEMQELPDGLRRARSNACVICVASQGLYQARCDAPIRVLRFGEGSTGPPRLPFSPLELGSRPTDRSTRGQIAAVRYATHASAAASAFPIPSTDFASPERFELQQPDTLPNPPRSRNTDSFLATNPRGDE